MKHAIPFFDSTEDEAWGVTWMLSMVAAVVGTVFFCITGAWLWTIAPAFAALYSYGIFGHVFWKLPVTDIERWKRYNALPKKHTDSIGMTRREFAGMTHKQRGEVMTQVEQLETFIKNRNDGMTIPSELRSRFAVAIEHEKDAWDREKESKKELKERGWDE